MSRKDIGVINAKGRGKDTNEDYHFGAGGKLFGDHDVHFLVIADGMGGHNNAESASHHAVESQERWWNDTIAVSSGIQEVIEAFENEQMDEFRRLNQELIDMGSKDNVKMGTTLSTVLVIDNMYMIHHIGDARVYRYSFSDNGSEETSELDGLRGLVQLTEDHTLLNRKVRQGEVSKEDPSARRIEGVLTQCLGVKGEVQPFVTFGTIRDEDIIFLCTDGVYKAVNDEQIRSIIRGSSKKNAQGIVDLIYGEIKQSDFSDDICILLMK